MKNSKKIRILFCTPFSGYTGSEVMLFAMLNHLNSEDFEVALFSMNRGGLLDTLPSSIPQYCYEPRKGIQNKVLNKSTGKSALERQIMQVHASFKPDLWYLNTMVLSDLAAIARKHKIKYAVHFHELLSQYKYVPADELEKMVHNAEFTVGCCEAVCNNLRVLGAKHINKQYECFDASQIKVVQGKTAQLRKEFHIPEGHKIIVMAGQRTDRKGADLFVDVAKEMRGKPVYFLWLGSAQNNGYELFLEKMISHYGLNNIRFLQPERMDYFNYLNLADIFFLSSREDPFPLVMLEAAFLGKYIVALNSGGVTEFLNANTGCIIPSWNIADIAKELERCIDEQTHAIKVGKSMEHVLSFDVKNQVKLFEEILKMECKV